MPSGPLFDGPEEDSDVFDCASHFGRVPRFGDQQFVSFFSLSLSHGSAKRKKLLAELASRKRFSDESGSKCLQAPEAMPQDLPSFSGKSIFTKYLERQGGF